MARTKSAPPITPISSGTISPCRALHESLDPSRALTSRRYAKKPALPRPSSRAPSARTQQNVRLTGSRASIPAWRCPPPARQVLRVRVEDILNADADSLLRLAPPGASNACSRGCPSASAPAGQDRRDRRGPRRPALTQGELTMHATKVGAHDPNTTRARCSTIGTSS